MSKRITEKTIHWDGREFKVKKLDAMTGCYILQTLLTKGLGIIGPVLSSKVEGGMPNLPKGLPAMSKQEFFDLQRDLLSVCEEKLSAGYTPVIGENGLPAVEDFDTNAPLVLVLTANSLVWNVADFFDASLLKGLKESLAGISLFKPKISAQASGDQ